MTTTPKVLIAPKLAEIAETPQYTSDNCKTAIDKFTATNTSGANQTLTVHLVTAGGAAAGPINAITKTISPGTTWPFPELVGHMLESGDVISTSASANTISIRASGRQFT